MRRSSTRDRGQTEPLAALIAVAAMAIGLSVYAGYVTDTLPGTSQRNVAESAIQDVWNKIEQSGVYPAEDDLGDIYSPTGSPGPSGLPQGYYVYINVTRTETGDSERGELFEYDDPSGASEERHVVFGPQGRTRGTVLTEIEDPDLGIPDGANHASRPIPIRRDHGDVVAGRLHVTAWEQ